MSQFNLAHRRDAEGAERKFLHKKTLRPLRLCGESISNMTEFLNFIHLPFKLRMPIVTSEY